jgi:hypothetical protein
MCGFCLEKALRSEGTASKVKVSLQYQPIKDIQTLIAIGEALAVI